MISIELGNCAGCPKVLELIEAAETTQNFTGHMAEEAMALEFDELFTPAMFNMFDAVDGVGLVGPNGEQINTPGELAVMLRKNIGKLANYIDNQADEKLEAAAKLVQECDGPLKMRASKAGRQIVATICNSPCLPTGPTCEEVYITRHSNQ